MVVDKERAYKDMLLQYNQSKKSEEALQQKVLEMERVIRAMDSEIENLKAQLN